MNLHPEIERVTKLKREAGDFDGAILDAAEYLQSKLREISGLKSVNTTLVTDVFDGQHLRISLNNDRNIGARNLFDGLFRIIRNDRGHRQSTAVQIEIPCKSDDECLWHLGFISLLLYWIENQNLSLAPELTSYRPISVMPYQLELRGKNLEGCRVSVNSMDAVVRQQGDGFIIASVPEGITEGTVSVFSGNIESNKLDFIFADTTHKNTFEVIAVDLPLFSDADCTKKRLEAKGLKLRTYEQGREILSVRPTTRNFTVGDYVDSEGSWDMATSIGESWYKDEITEDKKYAWTGSALFNPKVLGHIGVIVPIQLLIRPSKILLAPGDPLFLQAQLISKDGVRTDRKLVTKDITDWNTKDDSIAFVDKKGVLYAKNFGSTRVYCNHQKLLGVAEVEVANIIPGAPHEFFAGLTHMQEISFDSNGVLFICNQSSSISALYPDGNFVESIIKLPNLGDNEQRVDKICIDSKDNIYLRAYVPNAIYKFNKSDNYRKPVVLRSDTSTWGGIAVDSKGVVYIGGRNRQMLKLSPSGAEFFPTEGNPIVVEMIDDNRLIMGQAGGGNLISLYSTNDFSLIRSFAVDLLSSTTAMASWEGEIYAAGFHSKNIVKLDLVGDDHKEITKLPAIPGGMEFDSSGDLYVSMFTEDYICKLSI